ncbi:YdbL family protein [Dokdonella soli]|uniref:YdbL family protein n=1 Tax=Dokdonella soli TaxID=529810 RepID=A0ABN1IDP6_9GAMM
MRKFVVWAALATTLALPTACVTINVYFPEAAAEKAAEQFVDKVIGEKAKEHSPTPAEQPPPGKSPGAMLLDFVIPSAYAQQANVNIQTPQIQAIQTRMQQRFSSSLSKYCESGAVGFTNDGLVAVRDASSIPLAERAVVNTAVADENRDRQAVYREIALANGHAEWEAQIRSTFAKQWIQQAHAGWYYQDPSGTWKQK